VALMDIQQVYDLTIHKLQFAQKLQFPRNIDVDGSNAGFIPQGVKDAQCEQAVYLIAFDDSPIATQLTGVHEEFLGAGAVRVSTKYRGTGTFIAPMTMQLLSPYFRKTSTKLRRS
jgi:hypothetical protein